MLTALLPGLRQTRTPVVVGATCLLVVWLAVGSDRLIPSLTSSSLGVRRLAELGHLLGRGPVLAALALVAFLVGSLLTRRPDVSFSRLREQDTWGALEQWMEDLRAGSRRVDQLLHEYRPTFASGEATDLPGILETHHSVDAVIAAALEDFSGIVASLRHHHPALYQEYDRMESEGELRYSLVLPLYALTITAGATISWWWLLALTIPLVINRDGDRQARAAAQYVFEAMANGACDSPYAIALRTARERLPDDQSGSATATAEDSTDAWQDSFEWDEEPKWWWRTRLWVGRSVWPGGAFGWSATPWDREGRGRTIRNWPAWVPRYLLGGKQWEYEELDNEVGLDAPWRAGGTTTNSAGTDHDTTQEPNSSDPDVPRR